MNSESFIRRIVVLLVTFLSASLWTSAALALDPKKAITQYVHDVWTVDDGLPQSSILAITQTRDGYLWVGTWQGLARFDGVRFTVFDSGNTNEIKGNYVSAVYGDREGNLWFGSWPGLYRFRHGAFTHYTTKDGLSHDDVRTVYEDREGTLWIGTLGGLNRFKDGRFTGFTTKDGLLKNHVTSIHQDHEGNLWVGTWGGGLSRYQGGKFTVFTTKDGLAHDVVWSIYEDRKGSLWIGTAGGLSKYRDGRFSRYTTKDGLSHNSVYAVYEDRDGNLWIGTEGGGLNRFKDGRFTYYTTRDGLSHAVVTAIYEDREGSLWIGTWGGLNRFKDGILTTLTTNEGLPHDWVRSVFEDAGGSLWFGTVGNGLNRLKDGKYIHYTARDGLVGDIVAGLYGDRQGNLWVSTEGGGFYRMKGARFIRYGPKEGLEHDSVKSIYEDRDGNIWFGTSDGWLTRLRKGTLTSFTSKDGLENNGITSLYEDREGNLWIGTERGLIRFKNGEFTNYTTHVGFPSSKVNSIYQDHKGALWIGTRAEGLFRYKDGKCVNYTTREGLLDNAITVIFEDRNEELWMGSFRGIFRVSKKQLDEFAQGKIRSVTSVAYGKADGMKSVECNSGPPSGWKSNDGRLLFPTIKGVVVVDPDNMKLNAVPPPVVIEQVIANTQLVDLREKATLPPGQRELEFHYTGLSFLDPSRVKFKYKLEGYDEDWVDADTRRTAYYTNLSPGEYRFRVIACNNDGVWNETGAAVEFRLQPHWYETKWFYALLALGIIGLTIDLTRWFHKHRIRQLEERKRELETLVDERTKELQEANYELKERTQELQQTNRQLEELTHTLEQRVQEEVKARTEAERMAATGQLAFVVAHEVGGPLGVIRRMVEDLERKFNEPNKVRSGLDLMRRAVDRLSPMMNDLLSFAQSLSLEMASVDPHQLLEDAMSAYRVEHDSAFPEIKLISPPKLPPIMADRSRMVQVLVNLIKNANKHAQGVTRVTLSTEVVDGGSVLRIRVADDGAGIAPENLPHIFEPFFSTRKGAGGTGLGLAIVRRVVEGHGGRITADSPPNSGAIFTIDLPTKATGHTKAKI